MQEIGYIPVESDPAMTGKGAILGCSLCDEAMTRSHNVNRIARILINDLVISAFVGHVFFVYR